jgi:hypothetical protein
LSALIIDNVPLVKPYVEYYFYLKSFDTTSSQLKINKKGRIDKLQSHDEDIINWESFSEIETIVCHRLAASIYSLLYYELHFLEECFSENIPNTENRDIIIDSIKMKTISFKKIIKKCPIELVSTCKNYLNTLVTLENNGIYSRIEDTSHYENNGIYSSIENCLPDTNFFVALNFSTQIKNIAKRFKSVDDVKDLKFDFWDSLRNNDDPIIRFKQNLLGKYIESMTSIKWNHDLSVIVKKFEDGLLDANSDFQLIDLREWRLLDEFEEDPNVVKDEYADIDQDNFEPTRDKLKSENHFRSNEILSENECKIIFDHLENLKITTDNIYILGPRKKSSVRAVIDVLVRESLIPSHSITKLCIWIGDKINANIQSLPENDTNTYRDYEKRAEKMLMNSK